MRANIIKAIIVTTSTLLIANYSIADVISGTTFGVSGYIKVDGIFSDYSDGSLPSQSLGRDFYIPSLTPIGGEKESVQFDSHAKQSRIRLTSSSDTAGSSKIKGVLEIDFLVTPGGNERVSNSYVPRIRHAFIQYENWTIGQTWSTFQDVSVLPDTVNFVGGAEGVVFNRQTMVRYTTGAWEFALENPESTITPFGGGSRIVSDDGFTPDAVVRYKHTANWGHVSVAALARKLNYETTGIDTSESSYGISITSKVKVAKADDIRISVTMGSALGRYLALNAINGAVLDANGKLEAIDSSGVSIAYRKVWSNTLRSSFVYATLLVDNNTALTGLLATESTSSVTANIKYSPTPKLTFGAEFMRASREIESGSDGDLNRLQFSARYTF